MFLVSQKIKIEGHRVHSLFHQLFTNENLEYITSEDGLSNWILSKSFSEAKPSRS